MDLAGGMKSVYISIIFLTVGQRVLKYHYDQNGIGIDAEWLP